MKKIISIRKKSEDPLKREQFVRGNDNTVQTKILNIIADDPTQDYDFLIDDNGDKYVQTAKDLLGEVVNIIDDNYIAEIIGDENELMILVSTNEGALPQEYNIDQLNRVRKLSKGTDIGDRISDMEGSNLHYMRNPIDTGIESIQDYNKDNKNFEPNWNLKRLKPFKSYLVPTTTRINKRKKKK